MHGDLLQGRVIPEVQGAAHLPDVKNRGQRERPGCSVLSSVGKAFFPWGIVGRGAVDGRFGSALTLHYGK